MELTGKCKKEFEKWIVINEEIQDLKNVDSEMHHWLTYKGFKNLPESMQYGVYIDFFDSVDVICEVVHDHCKSKSWNVYLNEDWIIDSLSRSEGRAVVIDKANDLFNQQQP